MTLAYKCDMCGEYKDGFPTLEVDINDGISTGQHVLLELGDPVEWSLPDTRAEFCRKCSKDVIRFIDGGIRHE